MNFGENVKRMREERDMTKTDLAEKISTSIAFVSQMENGAKVPNVILAGKMARVFGCKIDDFFKD